MERTSFEQWKPREVARLLALVETERRYYQEMVAALPVALAVLAPDRAIISANKAFRQLVQLTGEEIRQKHIEQILPSDLLIERIRSAHVHGETGFFAIGTGDRNFRMAAIPIRSWEEEMQPETLLVLEPDEFTPAAPIAAPTPAPAAAPAPDLSALPAVIWQANASTFAFNFVGGAVESLIGFPASHWLNEPLFFTGRIHPDDRAAVMQLYEAAVKTGGEASAEYRAINTSGAPVWVRETVRAAEPGQPLISGVLMAIGERRYLGAQALAAGRIDALRGLSGRLAHDLNNPLMIVSGYSEDLLRALPQDAPARADLAEIVSAAKRMTELAGGLLSFTRAKAKDPERISLSEVVAGLEPRLQEFAGEIGIAFPQGAVWTLADAEQLEDALAALAAFAVENTQGAHKLTVTCHTGRLTELAPGSVLAPGLYACIDIHVPGQASTPARGVFEAIPPVSFLTRAYLNVRQWGGDIASAFDPVTGSAFSIFLPFAEAPYAEPAPAAEPIATPPAAQEEPAQEPASETPDEPEPLGTILVVEDEPGIRGLVRKILRRENYEVIEAGSAEEALTEAAAQDIVIDLLLTDVMLPGMGGRELAEALTVSHPGLKVVYVSGFTDDEGVRTGQFPPGSKFLQKPFTLSALMDAVKEAFGGE